MGLLTIERTGGLAGFGGPNLQSRGECALETLSPADQASVEALFKGGDKRAAKGAADGFSYRITCDGRTVTVPEALVPPALAATVVDSFK